MEKIRFTRDVKIRGIKKGEEFIVKRNIMGVCVVCTGEGRLNWIVSEPVLKRFGVLSGTPQFCFN